MKFIDRSPIYGEPHLSHENIGLSWQGLIQQHYQIRLPHSPPPWLVELMMAAFKVHRSARVYHEDNYDDLLTYASFAKHAQGKPGAPYEFGNTGSITLKYGGEAQPIDYGDGENQDGMPKSSQAERAAWADICKPKSAGEVNLNQDKLTKDLLERCLAKLEPSDHLVMGPKPDQGCLNQDKTGQTLTNPQNQPTLIK